jgi:alanyl-tRNA synthetase
LFESPFYPEGGGQIGDKGVLILEDNEIEIFDTKKISSDIVLF